MQGARSLPFIQELLRSRQSSPIEDEVTEIVKIGQLLKTSQSHLQTSQPRPARLKRFQLTCEAFEQLRPGNVSPTSSTQLTLSKAF